MAEVAITDGLVLNWEVDSYFSGSWKDKINKVALTTKYYKDNGDGTYSTPIGTCVKSDDGIEMRSDHSSVDGYTGYSCISMGNNNDYGSKKLSSIGLQNTITVEWIGRIDQESYSNGGTMFGIYYYSGSTSYAILRCYANSNGLFFGNFGYADTVGNITGLCHIVMVMSVNTVSSGSFSSEYSADISVYLNSPTPVIDTNLRYKTTFGSGDYNLHNAVSNFSSKFYGAVNTIRSWNRALTQEEVNQLFGTKKFYMKQSGSWNAISDVYKKENGIWVKKDDLASVFNENYNYVKA